MVAGGRISPAFPTFHHFATACSIWAGWRMLTAPAGPQQVEPESSVFAQQSLERYRQARRVLARIEIFPAALPHILRRGLFFPPPHSCADLQASPARRVCLPSTWHVGFCLHTAHTPTNTSYDAVTFAFCLGMGVVCMRMEGRWRSGTNCRLIFQLLHSQARSPKSHRAGSDKCFACRVFSVLLARVSRYCLPSILTPAPRSSWWTDSRLLKLTIVCQP